jgi:citrate synthase
MLARTASLIAHMSEELDNPIGFALSNEAVANEEYTGAVPAGFVASH